MKNNKRFWVIVFLGAVLGAPGCVSREKRINAKKEKLCQEIENNRDTLHNLRPKIAQQEKDSIARFDSVSPNSVLLNRKKREKHDLQIKLTMATEQCYQEYWVTNFPSYKKYIKSQFTVSEIAKLSQCAGKTHFTLTCDLDTNYYKSIDDILYGPYWREFADAVENMPTQLIKKYRCVRTRAEQLYPYIFVRNVFYDGGRITTYDTIQNSESVIFTAAIKTGVDVLRDSLRCVVPVKSMCDFNRLRNVSKVFTTDLHMFVESIYVGSDEYINLKSPLFASHYAELSDMVQQIMVLTNQINTLNARRNADIQKIQTYFKKEQAQQESETIERVKELQDSLDYYVSQLAR